MKKSAFLPAKALTVFFTVILAGLVFSGPIKAQTSSAKQLLTFSFANITGATGVINETNYTVAVTVPFSTDLTNLVATFTVSTGATVNIGGTAQVSGTTANNFTSTVIYTVVAQNGSTRNYYVTVSKASARTEKLLLTFEFRAFTPDVIGAINQTNHTVSLTVPFSTDLTTLVATFTSSDLSTVKIGSTTQVSGTTANNFTNPVTYTVVAENGTTQDYLVTVTKAAASTQRDITAFSFNGLSPAVTGTIDQVTQTINLTVPFATNLTALVATFTNSPYSTVTVGGVAQVSGTTANNFTSDKVYRVTAEDGTNYKDYTVHVTKTAASTANSILTFSFQGLTPAVTGVINQTAKTIALPVPWATNVTALVATFTHSPLSTVSVGTTAQSSGVTANDFTSPVVYKCTAEDGSVENYTVTVTKTPASTANQILTFSFAGLSPAVTGTIDQSAKTIALTVPFSTNVTGLVATFTSSPLSTVWVGSTQQVSATTANNFTSAVQYKCRAEDGSEEIYTVTVTKGAVSTAKTLLTFSFAGLTPAVTGTINETAKTVSLVVPNSQSVTALVATFTVSPLATVNIGGVGQVSGTTANNFTNPVVYTVVAEDGSVSNYTVTVTKAAASSLKQLLTFQFAGLTPAVTGTINETAKTVSVTVPYGTNVTALIATFTSSPLSTVKVGTTAQVSGTTANNFTSPVTYTVVAEDATTQAYVVTVTVTPISSAKAITAFSFTTPAVTGTISETAKTINLIVPYGTNVTALVANFTVSQFATVKVGSTVQVSGTTPNNFTTPQPYDVIAQDLSQVTYVVTVIIYEMPKRFLSFSIAGSATIGGDPVTFTANGTINETNRTIQVNVPNSAARTSMIPTFSLTDGVTAFIGSTQQVSGTTANDFTVVVTYILLATDGSTTTYQVTVSSNPVDTSKQLTSFAFLGLNPQVTGTINETAKTITAVLPFGTARTALVATFTTNSQLVRVKVGTTRQVSGTTANDFTLPVTYTLYAEDGTTAVYTATITTDPGSPAKDLTYFAFEDFNPDVVCSINQTTQIITGTVPNGSNRAALRAFFTASPFATVRIPNQGIQQSGLTINDFRAPVVYQVTAQDGSVKEYSVMVYEAPDTTKPVVTNNAQTATNLAGQYVMVRSNEPTGKVYIIRNTAVQQTVADLETAVEQDAGRFAYVTTANTDIPISTYNLTDGTYYAYAVDQAGNKSVKGTNAITIIDRTPPSVSVTAQTISNALNHTVNVSSSEASGFVYLIQEGVAQASKPQLDAAVTAKRGARGIVWNANTPVALSVYELSPGNYHAYAVDMSGNLSNASTNIVVITQASRLKSILAFSFNGLSPAAIGQISGTDIAVKVPVGTNLTSLVASFTLSPLSKAYVGLIEQVSGVTPNDFTLPVIYTVEAEDGTTLDYNVTVTFNTGIDDQDWLGLTRTYPNPFSDMLTIQMPQPAERIQVVNAIGQQVADIINPGAQVVELKTSSWHRGIYFVRFYRDDRFVGVQKLIRE
jgi:hypothetical protein